jgi:3-oxoacyl-[acyl-carrier-protein] synthase I
MKRWADYAMDRFGLVTALGFNAPATLAALRAGISGVRSTNWLDHENGEALQGAMVQLPQWWEGVGKLADLVAPAIHECLSDLAPEEAVATPLLIAVAAPERPGRFANLDAQLLPEVQARLGWAAHPASRLIADDQVGGYLALAHACDLIESGQARHVVVAGVDSYLQGETLDALQHRRRIMTPSNSNGFFPGEAGAAVRIKRADASCAGALRVLGAALAQEPAPIESLEPFRAQGLTQAVQGALMEAGVSLNEVAYRITDVSGEHYKFKEAAFVAGRLNGGERTVPLDLWHPIEYLGEIGAAILPCLLAQSAHAATHGYAPGPLCLCHIGSDAGARAALILRLHEPDTHVPVL